ncbi:MAG TPA: DUF5668 domain-containing protein [Terriglobia bacterium]|jgi:predicted membrane protein|nr:DUF5668 domain-containing protein [Terriglobia bacterium]
MSDERDERRSVGPRVVAGLSIGGKDRYSGLTAGIVIIGIGVLLLLDQEGILTFSHLVRFWPVLVIAWGLGAAVRAEENQGRLWGMLVVFVGAVFLLSALGYRHFELRHIWPFLVIAAGLWILYTSIQKGGKAAEGPNVGATGTPLDVSNLDLNRVDIFGGGKIRINTRHFRGGRWLAIFGGSQFDFTEADIEGDEATINITAVFGGGELVVPRSWQVDVRGAALFGGHNDETRPPLQDPATPRKKLILTGAWVFGGFNIKN